MAINRINKLVLHPKSLASHVYLNIKRYMSSITEEHKRQGNIFAFEQQRRREAVGRYEKIEVQYEGHPENTTLVMNKNISTPYDCAKHLGEKLENRSVVALLNRKSLWHMHKPIPDSCILELLHYNIVNPAPVNKVFWRTCSFLLGAVVSDAFKEGTRLHLHSFPSPSVKSGSFVYDVQLGLDNWEPTTSELKVLSIEFIRFCQEEHVIECLDVNKNIALEIFKNNPHKTKQIPDIAAHNGDKITLFKVGPHIDISRGPMLPNTSHLGRLTITNVIKLDTDIKGDPIYRFQGVALPSITRLNHFAYSLIEERGKILNSGRIPGVHSILTEDNSFVEQISQ